MVRNLRCALVVVVFVSMGGPAAAQTQSLAQASAQARKGPAVDPALRADIERLMDITGVSTTSVQLAGAVTDAFLNGLKQTQPSVPPRVVEIVREVMNTEFAQAFNGSEIRGQQIALYAKYFTQEDVRGLLAFYETELGKKTIAAMPSLTREGAAMGEQWARVNMPRVLEILEARLRSEGLLPATAKLR
jgi:hypothetical protein